MPDIDPAALTRSDSFIQPLAPSSLTSKLNGINTLATQKAAKTATTVQRIDLEPLYANLKASIGDHWSEYKEAISLFVLGQLNQNELSLRTDYFLTTDPSVEHLHNQLVAAIFANVPRDSPDAGVAPWVSANDKPTTLPKPISGDAAEQRLKAEVMQLPARDRRRLKEITDGDQTDPTIAAMAEYQLAKQLRSSDAVPASVGGFNRTNWDLEIRKRYSLPLASETGEFPDAETIHGRMVPICYEESLPNGCAPLCANFMATATEHFIKEVLSTVYTRTRSNMPGGSVNSILTHRFKKQLRKEEEAASRGDLVRAPGSGLLPVEVKEAAARKPLGMHDLRFALELGDCGLGQFPVIVGKVMNGDPEGQWEEYQKRKRDDEEAEKLEEESRRARLAHINGNGVNGIHGTNGALDDEMDDEDESWGWEGGSAADRMQLNALLDDCLAVGL
ncbi:transcriptional coactivator hfi1/ADA1 [Xylographa parallela]|nr:transcriptional coactivator hfi1/ADA1 [Xylographa parallela]